MLHSKVATIVVLVLALAGATWASIENKPVKVTHRNSGPRYEIEETVDRTKLTPVSEQNNQPNSNNINTDSAVDSTTGPRNPISMFIGQPPTAHTPDNNNDDDQVGHIAIRRIFLVPMMRPSMPEDDSAPAPSSPSSEPSGRRYASTLSEVENPFFPRLWPFGLSPRPQVEREHEPSAHRHIHLFGTDEASRPPVMAPEASEDRPTPALQEGVGEREESQASPKEPMVDPIHMLVDLMRQAINQAIMTPSSFLNKNATDSNKPAKEDDTTPTASGPTQDDGPFSLFGPMRPLGPRPQAPEESDRTDMASRPSNSKPQVNKESSEEVVEIGGKKYIRKTVINRHVGENIVMMTKRLIFVPLNETNDETSTTTTTSSSTTTTPVTTEASPSSSSTTMEPEQRKKEEVATVASTTTTTTTSAASPSTTTEQVQPSSTTTTTTTTTTTEQPSTTSSSTTTSSTTELPTSASTQDANNNGSNEESSRKLEKEQ